MQTGSIQSMVREQREDRADTILPSAWVSRGEAPLARGGRLLRLASTEAPVLDGTRPVIALLPQLEGPAFEVTRAAIARGARVYALIPEGAPHAPLLGTKSVLVRTVDAVPCAAVSDGRSGWLWCGPRGALHWRLELVAAQREALRALFLRLFWTGSRAAFWRADADTIATALATSAPFELPEVSTDSPIHAAPATWPSEDAVLAHAVGPLVPARSLERVWVPASGADHEALAARADDGVEIVSDGLLLPDAEVTPRGGALLLRAGPVPLRITLSRAQVKDLAALLRGPATWHFRTHLRLGGHEDARLWLPGEAAARPPVVEQQIDAGALEVEELRAVPDAAPLGFPPAGPLALAVRYRWRVDPPRLPRQAQVDPLVTHWSRVTEDHASRTTALRGRLEAAENRQRTLAGAWSRLAGTLLGLGREHRAVRDAMAAIADAAPTTPLEATEVRRRMETLEARASRLLADLDVTEQTARRDDAEAEQHAAWTADVDTAKAALPGVVKALEGETVRVASLEGELGWLEAAKPKRGKGKSSAKERDRQVKVSKVRDDLERTSKDVSRLKAERDALQARAESPFVFEPPPALVPRRRRRGRFVPESDPARAAPPIPEEALPRVGALWTHRRQRYLVITRWDDLAVGEQEARRLNARLVAPEETS